MPNSKIFCNIPWFELNINHDGSYDLCGCQNDKIVGTSLGKIYNIKTIPVQEYWNSTRLQESRLRKLGNEPDPMCRMCQAKDNIGYQSNRVKENLKSVIFHESFDRSFAQSPHKHYFDYSQHHHGLTQSTIHSLHINLGSTCNFSCRMCTPFSSSRLQTDYIKLEWLDAKDTFTHWTEDLDSWNNFVSFLDQSGSQIKVVHIIGGEVQFMPKFDFLIDYFINKGLASNVNISFTTNGSVNYSRYFSKLGQYKRCEIGVSIESIDKIGDYIRQGGIVEDICNNILSMKDCAPPNTQFVIRTVPSLLSLLTYHRLIEWAYNHQLPIDNSVLVEPNWLLSNLLPVHLKEQVVKNLTSLLETFPDTQGQYINQKDPAKIALSARNEIESILKLAKVTEPGNAGDLRKECAARLSKWDQLNKVNIRDYSLDLYKFLSEHGYCGA